MLSEVARLLQQIEDEAKSARLVLHGFCEGTARHEFIRSKYDRIGVYHQELGVIIGVEEATRLTVERLDQTL